MCLTILLVLTHLLSVLSFLLRKTPTIIGTGILAALGITMIYGGDAGIGMVPCYVAAIWGASAWLAAQASKKPKHPKRSTPNSINAFRQAKTRYRVLTWGVSGLILFAAFIIHALSYYHQRGSPQASGSPNALFEEQLKELDIIQNFIGSKDEMQLRNLFGFPRFLDVNLWIEKSGFAPQSYSPADVTAINAYIRQNVTQIDNRFGAYDQRGYMPRFTGKKGTVAALTLPKEYVANHGLLIKLSRP